MGGLDWQKFKNMIYAQCFWHDYSHTLFDEQKIVQAFWGQFGNELQNTHELYNIWLGKSTSVNLFPTKIVRNVWKYIHKYWLQHFQ